ncbi:MAG: periplasmic nitrate reductase, NapE protein [Granulosicoccus sp.]
MNQPAAKHTKKNEWRAFLFITVILAPVVAVLLVGSYGLSIWVYQMFAGPPTGG